MSYSANLDDALRTGGDVATNSGWIGFRRFVDSFDGLDELKHVCHFGWTNDLDGLEADLHQAIAAGGEDDNLDIARGLLTILDRRGNDAEVIAISDGCI